MYTFSVAALNCDIQRGDEATRTINLQGMPLTNCCKIMYLHIGMFVTILSFNANYHILNIMHVRICNGSVSSRTNDLQYYIIS